MAIPELGAAPEAVLWSTPPRQFLLRRYASGLAKFVRAKPLGAACGFIVIFFVIIGDLVPETLNKAASTFGIAESPVPYLADQITGNLGLIHHYREQNLEHRLEESSSEYLLGTDQLGRDILGRLLYGARVAVMVSFGAVLISSVMQIVISVPAGYFGGWYDKLMYRIVDVVDALPTLIILIAVLGLFGQGLWEMIVVIGVIYSFGGRYLRGQTISLVNTPFVEAGRTIGASHMRIMLRYIVPNIMPLIIHGATLRLGIIVLLEASLSFLGFGLPPPFPSWGQMLSLDGREFMRHQPGLAIYPGLAIGLLVFSFNLFGDALRDVLDPRLRGSR